MADTKQQIDALTRAVQASDTSRRVGWARAYESGSKVDDLLREVNMMRAERDIYRGATSWMYGFLESYVARHTSGPVREALDGLITSKELVLDDKIQRKGRRAGGDALALLPPDDVAKRRQGREERVKQNVRDSDRVWRQVKDRLAKQNGFRDGNEVAAFLASRKQSEVEAWRASQDA